MSNLGRYQEVTTEAAKYGGMDQYLAAIRRDALWSKGPLIGLAGLAVGVAGVTGVQALVERRRRARAEALAAEAVLRGEESG